MSASRTPRGTAKTPAPARSPVLPVDPAWYAHHLAGLESVLEGWLEHQRIAPVILITGASGVGKRETAYSLAQWIFCERSGWGSSPREPRPGVACGECSACVKALHGSWVDFQEISAEGTDDADEDAEGAKSAASATLKIDQFRDLKASQGFGGFDGGFRITLIREADRMTPQAANSVLKLLEEPPPGWILFLTANDVSQLLPTLVSRCQTFRLRPLAAGLVTEILTRQGISGDRARACAELAQGSVRKASQLAQDETWEKRTQILKFLDSPHLELNALVDWAAQDPRHLQLLLDQLELALEEMLRWTLNPAGHSFTQRALKPVVSGRKESPVELRRLWTRQAERLFRARSEALTPVNKKLLVQDLLLPFC